MLVAAAITTIALHASGDEDPRRRAVQGGIFDGWRCAEVGFPTMPRFEDYTKSSYGTLATKDFICALGLYLDSPDITHGEKFDHLASQARRGEEWNKALSPYLAEMDWERYLEDVYRRARSFRPDEWTTVARAMGVHLREDPQKRAPPEKLLRLFFEQALRSETSWVRGTMIRWFEGPWATVEQAVAIAKRLPLEDAPHIREAILRVLVTHDDPRTNKVVRDFLRGPLEFEVLKGLCQRDSSTEPFLGNQNRHDFLPELRALRDRLAGVTDVRKRYEAREAMKILDQLIPSLQAKKDANAPTCPDRRPKQPKQGLDGGS